MTVISRLYQNTPKVSKRNKLTNQKEIQMKKVNPAVLEKLVSSSLLEDEMMMGDDSLDMDTSSSESVFDYVVKAMCSSEEGEETEQEFTVQAVDPEEAKMLAMDMAKESGYTTCQITSVELAQEEVSSDDMGSEDMELDSSSDEDQMVPMESKKKNKRI